MHGPTGRPRHRPEDAAGARDRPHRPPVPDVERRHHRPGGDGMEQAGAEEDSDNFIRHGRLAPPEDGAGPRQLEQDGERYNLQGVKVYTAEWHNGSRGWKLTDPEAQTFLDKCKELGIKNIHAHKGP